MFIIEKPYVSELLIDTIVQNDWIVLDNKAIRDAEIEEGAIDLIPPPIAKDYYLKQEYPLIYGNSENAVSWILDNLPDSKLACYIKTFKDKAIFREMLKELYPDFYYKVIDMEELKKLQPEKIQYPVVIKPATGFLSFGVHTLKERGEWKEVINSIEKEMNKATSLYSNNVINSSKFIIEQMIDGDEFAIDAYYDRNGEPVILNIFQHPLLNEKDVRDRIYLTSAEIMVKYMAKFGLFLKEIGELKDIKNFAMHVELKVSSDNKIIPIEINPMRFAGWCASDVAKYAWGINIYEYFYKQKRPDWNTLLNEKGKDIYYFSMIEVPKDVEKAKIKGFEYDKFLANYSNIIELRRINFDWNPLFAIVFGSMQDKHEVGRLLELKTKDFIL